MPRIALTTSLLLVFLMTACSNSGGEHTSDFVPTTISEDNQFPLSPTAISSKETVAHPATQTVLAEHPTLDPTPKSVPSITTEPTTTPTHTLKLPDPGAYSWITVVSDLRAPVGLSYPADGSNRLFII